MTGMKFLDYQEAKATIGTEVWADWDNGRQ